MIVNVTRNRLNLVLSFILSEEKLFKTHESMFNEAVIETSKNGHLGCCLLLVDKITDEEILNQAIRIAEENSNFDVANLLPGFKFRN